MATCKSSANRASFIPSPCSRTHPHPRHQTAWGAIRPRHPHHRHPPPLVPRHPALLVSSMRSWLWTGRTSTYQAVAMRFKYALRSLSWIPASVCPRGDARILRPKEGRNGHEGREVLDEVPGHNWHLRQFWSRFQEGKEPISRIEEGARAVVQSNHLEFTQALQRRIFGKYINGELKPLLASTGRHYREA